MNETGTAQPIAGKVVKKRFKDREKGVKFKFNIGDSVKIKHFPIKFVIYERKNRYEHPFYDVQNFDAEGGMRFYTDQIEEILELCPEE